MYTWLVFLHILGIFGFLLAHGASASVAFAVRGERNMERVRAMLMVSAQSYKLMYLSLLVLFLSGLIAGFIGNWWRFGWFLISIVLLLVIGYAMTPFGSRILGQARKAAGLPYYEKGKTRPPVEPASDDEIFAILAKINPHLLTTIGFGGFAIIAWLMMFKPF